MQADARQLARAEARRLAGRSIGNQAAEILNNIDAMEFAVDEAARAEELLPSGLCDIHRALLARSIGARGAGEVRDAQNWIGGNDYNPCGADYVPPPAEEVAPLLDDLCAFANDDLLPPLLQAAAAHAQFETIHPFEDGNGRTGRALVQVILRRRGLAPAFVPPVSVVFFAATRALHRRSGRVSGGPSRRMGVALRGSDGAVGAARPALRRSRRRSPATLAAAAA